MSTAVSRSASQPRYRKSPAIYKGLVLWNSAAESDIASAKTLSWDTGAPNHTAAEGSVYIRLDASDADLVFYRNTDGAATWETVVGSEVTDLLAATNPWTGANTFAHATGVTSNTITERTAAAGVTVDGLLLKDGLVRSNEFVKATVACADATGGATTALLSVQLYQADGTTAISAARQCLLVFSSLQYLDAAGPTNASLTLGTVTAGSIVSAIVVGSVYLIETSAAGLFGCTATNTDDETVYVAVKTAHGGVSDVAKSCLVLGSNSDSATWSA